MRVLQNDYKLPFCPVCFTASPIPELQLVFGVYTLDTRICSGLSDQCMVASIQTVVH